MQTVKRPQRTPPRRQEDEPAAGAPQAVPAVSEAYTKDGDVFDMVWRFFCSTRLALVLILLIAAASLAGAVLVQAPAGITSDPAEYASWLARLRPKYGPLTDLLSTLQFFDVFNSIWFRLLLATLMVNTIVCTVNRWNGIWRSIAKPRVRMGDGFFRKASHAAVFSSNGRGVEATAEAVAGSLAARRYRVLTERDDGRAYLYADKNRYGKLGTFLNHLSLVLIMVGAISGGMFGFRDRDFVVPVGSERPVGHGTNLTLRVDQFIDEYYPEGPPKDYRSDAVLLDDGKEVARHTIRVNDPLDYQGIRFYQSFFGPAAAIQVKDANGNVVFDDGVGLAWQSNENRPLGSISLPQSGLEVYVVGPAQTGRSDPLIPAGQMRVEIYRTGQRTPEAMDNLVMGRPKKIGDYEFTFKREMQFTGLQVSKDPGAPIIWIASTLLVIGLALVFYFPHRRLWFVIRPDEKRQTQVTLGATARRDMGFEEEFRRVVGAVEAGLAAGQSECSPKGGG